MDRVVLRVAIAASAAMLLWMARPLFAGDVPFTGDLLHFHYPLRDFYARALTAGQRFDWMPSLFGGFYVVGEGQLGGYHPLHWLLYRFVPLDTAFALELVAAYDASFATTFSLPPLQLLQLFNPYLFWGRVVRWNEAPGAGDEFAQCRWPSVARSVRSV